MIQNILNEEDLYLLTEETVKNGNFEKAETDIDTYEELEKTNNPQEFNSDQQSVIFLDFLNKKEMNDPKYKLCSKELDPELCLF